MVLDLVLLAVGFALGALADAKFPALDALAQSALVALHLND